MNATLISNPEPAVEPNCWGPLYNLLCRIHRDSGEYVARHGLDQAARDADDIVLRLFEERGIAK